MQATSTRLDDCIRDMHWLSNYYLGAGVNALTGKVSSVSALKDCSALVSRGAVKETYSMRVLCTGETVRQELGLSLGQYFNIAPVVDCLLHGMASLRDEVVATTTTSTILVLYQCETSDDDAFSQYELTEDAVALARKDPDAFRDKYGDYFVASAKRGSVFAAIARCTFRSHAARSNFSALLEAKATSAFGIEAAAHIDRELANADADIYVRTYSIGLEDGAHKKDPSPPMYGLRTFGQILPILDWFKRHQEGICLHGLLRHYSSAVGMGGLISNELPVPTSIFDDIAKLRDTLLSCGVFVNSLPSYTNKEKITDGFRSDYRTIMHEVHRSQSELVSPTMKARLTLLVERASCLEADLARFYEVREIFDDILRHLTLEPGPKRVTRGEAWAFGLNTHHSIPSFVIEEGPSVDVHIRSWRFRNNARGRLLRRPDEHIVGWKVTAGRPESTTWRQQTHAIILAPEGEITCRREHAWRTWFKPCSWTFTTFVVRSNPYLDLFYVKDHKEKAVMTTLVTERTTAAATGSIAQPKMTWLQRLI